MVPGLCKGISMSDGSGHASQRGMALFIVLWVIAVLIVIVLSLSLMTRTESQAALSFQKSLEKKYLAEAALQRGIAELFYRSQYRGQAVILEGREVLSVDGTPYQGQIGEGRYTFRVMSENGKINVNALTEESGIVLKNLLVNSGVREEDADTIVDSVLDWKDADDFHRLHGAESDYYLSLPNPYKARNADFEALEELLLVKGVTPEILFGSGGKEGVIPFLTLYSNTDKIDISVAPREVLMAIPGMTADAAARIIEFRKAAEFRGVEDIQDIGAESYAMMEPYIGASEPSVFTIDAAGYTDSAAKSIHVRATIALEGDRKFRYLYYKSPAERTS
jgi:general secretion pathway protein K